MLKDKATKLRHPLVGIPASVRYIESNLAFHGTGEQYYKAIINFVGAHVVTIPSLANPDNALGLLDNIDGLLLTGSFSNIHPHVYGMSPARDAGYYDSLRDQSTLPLIRHAVDRGIPIFGICRGMQELNVAFGGTLHQKLHEVPGRLDHRSEASLPLTEQFHLAHEISIIPGGIIAGLTTEARIMVNTSHMQGVDKVAPGLRIEAIADDDTIEALSVQYAKAFALAVQFHPEWYTKKTPFYAQLFGAFKDAVEKFSCTK